MCTERLQDSLSANDLSCFSLLPSSTRTLTIDDSGGYSQNGAGRGLRGTFVHGCMLDEWLVACDREKLTFGEQLFAPFACIRLGWYLQTIFVFEELENSSHRKSLSKIFLFFRIDSIEQCGTQNSVQHSECRVQWHGLRLSAASDAFAYVLFFLCFLLRKGFTSSVLAVLGLCLRLLAFVTGRLTATSRLPDLANSLHV